MTMAVDMLVVEDDPNDVILLRRAMRKAATEISHDLASDGDAAVAWLERAAARDEVPRVVLLDLKLPRRSGFDVLAWMKAHPVIRRVPVVVFTSSGVSGDVLRAYDLGANSYLTKPAEPRALEAIIAQVDRYWLRANLTR